GRTFIFGRPSGTVSTWPESSCPLRVADGHRWPYTAGHTWRPTGGQGPVTAFVPWPRVGRTRTNDRTSLPARYIGRTAWPTGAASGHAPDRSHLQYLTAPSSCVSTRPPHCWPRPTRLGQRVSAKLAHWPQPQPDAPQYAKRVGDCESFDFSCRLVSSTIPVLSYTEFRVGRSCSLRP